MTNEIEHGWAEAAEVLETRMDAFEEADQLADDLPDRFRAVEVYTGDGTRFAVEKKCKYEPYWIPIARFTVDDAAYEWAEELAKGTPDNIRGVLDYGTREVTLEALIE